MGITLECPISALCLLRLLLLLEMVKSRLWWPYWWLLLLSIAVAIFLSCDLEKLPKRSFSSHHMAWSSLLCYVSLVAWSRAAGDIVRLWDKRFHPHCSRQPPYLRSRIGITQVLLRESTFMPSDFTRTISPPPPVKQKLMYFDRVFSGQTLYSNLSSKCRVFVNFGHLLFVSKVHPRVSR